MSEHEPPSLCASTKADATQRRWVCDVDGCGKAYTKEARLVEHQRSHTGERPFVCEHPGCGASYMRSTHLTAHSRSHMDDSMRPCRCPHAGCEKRFWTQQHVRRHVLSCHTMDAGQHAVSAQHAHDMLGIERGQPLTGLYRCESPGCDLLFFKRKYLRQHVREVHADSDCSEYPFVCEHEGCSQRFATNAKRRHHARIHEEGRYRCILPHSMPPPPNHPPYTVQRDMPGWSFSTWTHLQRHMRLCHPPTCSVCGRSYASRDQLKRHAVVHDATSSSLSTAESIDVAEWTCPWNGCEHVFLSRYALQVHVSRVHFGDKPFQCDVCGQSFGYKHLLRRHQMRLHESKVAAETESKADPGLELRPALLSHDHVSSMQTSLDAGRAHMRSHGPSHLVRLMGMGRKRARRERILSCPWHVVCERNAHQDDSQAEEPLGLEPCPKKFARLYDVQRHLASVHGMELSDAELRSVMPENDIAQLPAPRELKRLRTEL